MKIAIITSGFLPIPATKGGAVEHLVNILIDKNETYREVEFNVISIYDKNAYYKAQKYNNSNFIFVKSNCIIKFLDEILYWVITKILRKSNSHSYKFVFQRLNYLIKASKILKKNNYDCVILENHPTQFFTLKLHKNYIKYKDKYLYHCHNDINNIYGCEKLLKNTKKIITISDYISKGLLNSFEFLNGENIFLLKNCIEIDNVVKNFDIKKIKAKFKIDNNKKIIVYVGRLVKEKGILELIKSLKFLKTKNVQLIIVGGSISKIDAKTLFIKELKNETDKVEHQNKIVYTGYVEHDDIYQLYKIADVVVLPSIWEEPAGLTMLEALASNVPLITTDVGGIKEYISDKNAILLKNDEKLIENIATSIDLILNDKTLKMKLSKDGYNCAKKYNPDKYYKDFIKIIKE